MYTLKDKKTDTAKGEVLSMSKGDFIAIRLKSDKSVHVEHKHLAERLIKKGLAEEVKGAELVDSAEAEAEALEARNGKGNK